MADDLGALCGAAMAHSRTSVHVFDAVMRRYHAHMIALRRSRMRRMPTGKPIAVTPRDIAIFRALARYRYLRSTYIHAFVGGASETRFKERLGDLFHEGYIDRPAKQWEFASARYRPVVYEMGDGARRVLSESGVVVDDGRTFLAANAHRQFAHALMICELLASIELGTRLRSGIRFIPWPEILAKAPAETRASAAPFRFPAPSGGIVPDGIFGIEYAAGENEKKTYRFFALEADRGTMPIARSNAKQTSYLGKLAAYGNVISGNIYKSHLGVPNLLVLTVTTSGRRLDEIMGRFAEKSETASTFLFKALDAFGIASPALHLFTDPWLRLGAPPLRIDR